MKNVGEEIKRILPDRFLERKAALIKRIKDHPEVLRLLAEYPDQVDVERDLSNLGNHISCFDHCQSCPGLNACQNEFPGHSSHEEVSEKQSMLIFRLKKCPKLLAFEKQTSNQKKIKSHHIPAHITAATFEDLENDPLRRLAIAECINFCAGYQKGVTRKGLYLYGPMGVGKSRVVGAIANEMAGMGEEVIMVYVPEFLEEIKESFSTNDVHSKLAALMEVDILILDDIGAGQSSSWTRDGVLSPVLNMRMETKPTIFTSNLTLSELSNYFVTARDSKNQMDRRQHEINAARIMERIEPFVKALHVGGRNRRREG
ncbi:primosomal protein DnaI [Paenibacillus graminis]|uniref:AAA+ ATPase domain-containing protein n=1 Tax=Paenibacillus graminis TaxID=189425 RepID=A0A089MDI3_9BACL|nr:primosomal protein DnaI [Paenibacillus graminis]AIQ70395.1 hypothetical protein PGRAT_24250 [Paenibacillus graminis]MEC0170293.1 primosomal protein DnaI [Paenibacillus graminis]